MIHTTKLIKQNQTMEWTGKPVIYLAGDSTMQSYGEDQRPQAGWGEYLLSALDPVNEIRRFHRENSPFSNQLTYESRDLIVDNCAMAGRSSRSFREEGRLWDIVGNIREGDYLIIQFGHNDAAADKPERYVKVEDFSESLRFYINSAKENGATPVLVSSISLRPCENTATGKLDEIASALPYYAFVMEEMADKSGLLYIDMGRLTREACNRSPEETVTWYKRDDVHLVGKGADFFAGLFAEKFKEMILQNHQ